MNTRNHKKRFALCHVAVAVLITTIAQGAPVVAQVAPATAPRAYTENFESVFVPVPTVPIAPNSPSVVRGQIPAGWTEDSTYPGANVAVTYSQVPDAPFGKGALRMDTTRVTTGNSGLRLDNLQLAANTFYRLRITARTGNGSSVNLALRSAAPHKNYWSQTISPGAEWKPFEFIIPPLAAEDKTAQFIIIASQPAQMDFDEFSLTPIRDDEVGASFTGKGNLLLQSSFPTGLAAPAYGGVAGFEQPDLATIGPSGLPALHVKPAILFYDAKGKPYYTNTVTAPFVGKPNAVHTVSVFLKGAREGQRVFLQLTPPETGSPLTYRSVLNLSTGWKRYEFSVKLPYDPKGYYLAQLMSAGYDEQVAPFWVDQIQVEVGDKATPFARGASVELALSTPKNFALFFENEPLQVEATVYGDVKPNTLLTGTFYDAQGRAYPVKSQPLKAGLKTQKVAFSLPRRNEPALGVYRFVAEAKQGQNAVSRPGEISMGRVRRPRLANQLAPDSPFGIHVAIFSIHGQDAPRHMQVAQDLGFKWLRQEISWSQIERADGSWDFSGFDRFVQNARQRNFSILGIFSGGPAKYLVNPEANTGWNYWAGMVRPEHLPTLSAATRRISERYKGIITEWETQNESDLPNFSFGAIVDGKKVAKTSEQMVQLQKVNYEAVNAVDPNNRIWWDLAWARVPESEAFVKGATEAGIWPYVEGFSFHLYNGNFHGFPGDAVQQRIEKVRSVMPADKKHLPIWNTEGGFWPSELRDETPLTPPFATTGRNEYFADWVVRYYVSNFANGIPKFFMFNINGPTPYGHELMNADGSPSRAAVSFSNLAWYLEGKTFRKMVPLQNGVNLYLFSNGKSSVAIPLSSNAGRLNLAAPLRGITARDTYGNALTFPARIGDAPTFWSGEMSVDELGARLSAAF